MELALSTPKVERLVVAVSESMERALLRSKSTWLVDPTVVMFLPPTSVRVSLLVIESDPVSPAAVNDVNDPEHTPLLLVQTRPPPSARSLPATSSLPAIVEVPVPCTVMRLPMVEVPVTSD